MTTSSVTQATVFVLVAGLPPHVGDRLHQRAASRLAELGLTVVATTEFWQGGPGCILGVELPTVPAPTFLFALGEKGKPAEAVAEEAVRQVELFLQAQPLGVDEHSADQLLLPLALAEGPSRFRVANVSSHLLTNASVIEQFLPRRIHCERDEGIPGVVNIS